jgi:SAM-dependent methyltransferase
MRAEPPPIDPPPADAPPHAPPPQRRWWGARWYRLPYVTTNVIFFDWIRTRLTPESVVLDAGAGTAPLDPVRRLRGQVARVCGIDVDPAVLANNALDEARVVTGYEWPYPDKTFDAAVSDYVLEHVADPAAYFAEVRRVLRAGAPFFFRTVNALHPGTALGRCLSLGAFAWLIHRMDPASRDHHDPYPAVWRANTAGRLRRLLGEAGFAAVDLRRREEPPTYLAGLGPFAMAGVAWERVANAVPCFAPLRVTLYGCAT